MKAFLCLSLLLCCLCLRGSALPRLQDHSFKVYQLPGKADKFSGMYMSKRNEIIKYHTRLKCFSANYPLMFKKKAKTPITNTFRVKLCYCICQLDETLVLNLKKEKIKKANPLRANQGKEDLLATIM